MAAPGGAAGVVTFEGPAEDVNLSDCHSTVFAFGASDLVVD